MTDDGRRGSIDASPLDAAAPSPLTSAAGADDELYEQALGALASSVALLEALGRRHAAPSPGQLDRSRALASRCASVSEDASEDAPGILEKPKASGSRMAAWKRRAELAMTAQHMARKAHQRRQKALDDRERLRIAAASSMSGKKPEEYNAEEARAKVHGDTLERSLARADAACCGKKADAPQEKRRKKGRGYLDRSASQTENMMLRLAMMSSAREASRFSVHPESRLVQRESYAIILAMLFTVVEMPLSLGFGDDAVNRGPVMPGVLCALDMLFIADVALNCVTGVQDGAGKGRDVPSFHGSSLGRLLPVSADFWTSDHPSERSRSVDAFSGTRARGTLTRSDVESPVSPPRSRTGRRSSCSSRGSWRGI